MRGLMQVPRGVAVLWLSFALLGGHVLSLGQSFAAKVYLQKGEGGAGLDALLELGEPDQFNLAMIGCRDFGKTQKVQLGLYVNRDKSLPELERVGNQKDEELDLYLCVNEICEEQNWKIFESGTGDTYFTTVAFPKDGESIKSIRVILPNETRKWEYRGEVDGVLKRICR